MVTSAPGAPRRRLPVSGSSPTGAVIARQGTPAARARITRSIPACVGTGGTIASVEPPSASITSATSSMPARKCAASRMSGTRKRRAFVSDSSRSHAADAAACSGRARVPQRATTIGVPAAAMRRPASRARADSAPEPARIKTGAPEAAPPAAIRPLASASASSAIASPPLASSCSEVCPSRSAFASMPRIAAIETGARLRCLRQRVATGATHAEICSGLTTPRTLGREGRFNMSRG